MTKNVLAALILAAGVGRAADDLKPLNVKLGLWETTTVSERSGMPSLPADALAKMPPEQRARIEAQLKSMSAPQTTTKQSCVTQDDVNKMFDLNNDGNKSCQRTIVSSTSTKQELKLSCDTPGNKGTGTVKIEVTDSTHVNGLVHMNVGNNGRTMDMKVTITGKWLGSSCGDVKPNGKE